jgi:molybdopterin molybdotransferase
MITSQEATRIIQETAHSFGLEEVESVRARGRILAEDVRADRPFPPFDRICMDGIAIDHQAFQKGQRVFSVQGIQAAGSPPQALSSPENAIEVMTGAMMPSGASTVIRYEDLKPLSDGRFEVMIDVKDRANIHYLGEDHPSGEVLLKAGTRIRSAEVALCATVGRERVSVQALPKVAIISTGDELVEIGDTPQPYQIRKSNVHMLMTEVESYGLTPVSFHIPDDRDKIREVLSHALDNFDVLLMSGGVSKGKYDHLPEVLADLGVQQLFHRVSQRPGKPFWFGKTKETVVFAFPGNPVSTLVGCLKYFRPWLSSCFGIEEVRPWVPLLTDFEFKPSLSYFAQAKLIHTPQGSRAEIIKGNGSGDMVSLSIVDGFLELPLDRNVFRAGESFPFIKM